jgi:pre-mRNA-processing factor 17
MNQLAGYGSSEDDGSGGEETIILKPLVKAPLALDVAVDGLHTSSFSSAYDGSMAIYDAHSRSSQDIAENQHIGQRNTKISEMYAPVAGPSNPNSARGLNIASTGIQGSLTTTSIEYQTFNDEFRAHNRARVSKSNTNTNNASSSSNKKSSKRKFEETNTEYAVDDNVDGPWGQAILTDKHKQEEKDMSEILAKKAYIDEQKLLKKQGKKDSAYESDSNSNSNNIASNAKKSVAVSSDVDISDEKNSSNSNSKSNTINNFEIRTTFHGREQVDYQGRPWTHVPAGVRPHTDPLDETCYIPKKCVKKFTGHTKGVQAIEFIPNTGHLLLSAGLDGKCKIWDIYNDKDVRRTYIGHSLGVRAINFSNTGLQYLSSGYDNMTRLWDTETGQVIGSYTTGRMGYDCKFYPVDNNIFLIASDDKKIYQWDSRSSENTGNSPVNEYTHHLDKVNTITFYDQGRKFFSTSDDKKILCWEYDINVPIRMIAEPEMHSIPSVTKHPTNNYWCGQSMDNTIVSYSCNDEKVKLLKKKVFKGHNNAGYACQIGFSHNGNYVSSGDGFGMLYVWDWKNTRLYTKFQAHDNGPCIGNIWHPIHSSWMATCGWDGLVKLWQ